MTCPPLVIRHRHRHKHRHRHRHDECTNALKNYRMEQQGICQKDDVPKRQILLTNVEVGQCSDK